MEKQTVQQSESGYRFIKTHCCSSRVFLTLADISSLKSGKILHRNCSGCKGTVAIKLGG